MRAWVRVTAVLAAAGGLAAVSACGGESKSTAPGAAGGRPKVAVVTNNVAEFWSICEAGATKAAAENDVELIFRQPPGGSVTSQKEILDTVTKQGIAGIAVSVLDPAEQTADLARIAARMPLLTMDNDAEGSNRLAYIGIDNYEAGKAVGRLVKKAKPDGGTVAMFIGVTTSANAKARVAGVLDELAGAKGAKGPQYGKFALYQNEPLTDGTDETKAQDNVKDVLEKLKGTPDLTLVGLYAYNPKNALLAVRSKGLVGKVTIVGFDEDGLTLEGIEKGEIVGTVVQDPFNYGARSVAVLAALARGDKSKLPKDPIAYRVVTKDGGPDESFGGLAIKNLKAADFAKSLRDDLASVKK